jgi:TolA-binding protein
MFEYISQILKSFTQGQRILALLILVVSIVTITLGPSLINSNTSTCDELTVRLKSQEQQIIELNQRVNELNTQLLTGQKECTNNLIEKQKEIMDIVNGMIKDAERSNKQTIIKNNETHETTMKRVDEGNGSTGDEVSEMRIPEPEPKVIIVKDNTDMVKKLKTMKSKIQNNFNENK